MMKNRIQLLQRVPLFSQLAEEQLQILALGLGSVVVERGATVFHQGSYGEMLYIVAEGQVRIFTMSPLGQELGVSICGDGDFFGELALLDGQPRSASAAAMTRTALLTLHRAAFRECIRSMPEIALSVLATLSNRLRQTNTYIEHLAGHSAPQRVVRRLLDLAEQHGVSDGGARISLRLTQDDLASLAGTTRETVNRVLSGLRDQGLIRIERGRVSVLNLNQLEQSLEIEAI